MTSATRSRVLCILFAAVEHARFASARVLAMVRAAIAAFMARARGQA